MDTVAGEWIMKGCRRSDPGCLHSSEDLLDMIREQIRKHFPRATDREIQKVLGIPDPAHENYD